ncbi:MAG TPA: mechanosensitive ion channel family protein [Acidimicrobiia bacterium]
MEAATSLWITSAIIVGVTLLIYVGLIKLGGRFVARLQSRSPGSASRVATLWVMVRRVILVVVFVLALLMILDLWGFGLSPFIAVGTVAAAAIGFGAQDVVKDLLAGFFILAEDQYHIGDTVTIAGTSGTVQDIQFRVTVLRDLEGNVHYVPNGQITVTSNFTSLYAQPVIDVGIAYGADLDRAMEVLLDVLQALADDPAWTERIIEPPELLGVEELADSAVILRARLTTQADERWAVRREALGRIKKRFDAEGIEIPFPHIKVFQAEG